MAFDFFYGIVECASCAFSSAFPLLFVCFSLLGFFGFHFVLFILYSIIL